MKKPNVTIGDMMAQRLLHLRACQDGIGWIATRRSESAAWRNCHRGDWMLWLAAKVEVCPKILTLAAAGCARLALPLVPGRRNLARTRIEAAERWAAGRITLEHPGLRTRIVVDGGAFDLPARLAILSAYYASKCPADTAYAIWGAGACCDALACRSMDRPHWKRYRDARAQSADVVRATIPWALVKQGLARLESSS